jgi:aspartyl-tRNA(Asn)/glutamyl-tRNA(Gln) amidotransferase subunit A
MKPIADWSLVETADAIASRRVSAVEVCEAILKGIKSSQPKLNAYIRIDEDSAQASAKAADSVLASGQKIGPLHGVPLDHKDMFYRPGVPVTCGSAIRRNFVPDHLATVLARLDGAGATSIGALNMSEFANGPTGVNVHFGATRNPWNPEHMTGGSSSGSGTAVAGRLTYASLGSDTGGSIRLPAGICGIYGMKPTQGRVPRYGAMGLSFSLDCIGPLARTVRDCARVLKVVAGADPNDATSAEIPVDDYEADLSAGAAGVRVAVATNHYWDGMSVEVGDLLEDALACLAKLGANITRRDVPYHNELRGLGSIIIASEFCTLHDEWLRTQHDEYAPLIPARMKHGYAYTAVEYLKAVQVRPRIVKAFVDDVFGSADALFLPVLRFPVPTIADVDVRDGESMNEVLNSINHCTWPMNYLGLPGLSVPGGFTRNGLPVGFQLIGRPFAEATLLKLAAAYERETCWPDRKPPSFQ